MNELAVIEAPQNLVQNVMQLRDEMPDGTCPFVFIPKVTQEPVYTYMPAGQTLLQMLGGEETAKSVRVYVGGAEVPAEYWAKLKPKAGTHICVEFYPQGGSARKWILTIVAVVAIVFSYGAASGAAWAAIGGLSASTVAIGAAVIAGLALAMIPPPSMNLDSGNAGAAGSQLKSLTGTSNNAAPYNAIPIVLGDYTFYPSHAALPYTEILGNDQYLRMLLDLGLGDLDVSDVVIGNTPIDNYDDVQYEITPNPTIFTQDVFELSVGTNLTDNGATDTRTTQTVCTEISLDLVFSNGLFGADKKGNNVAGSTSFNIQYNKVGTSTWTSVTGATGLSLTGGLQVSGSNLSMYSASRDAIRCGVRWKVPSGQYNVIVTRGATSWNGAMSGATQGDCAWSVLRSINQQNPSTSGTTKLAIRIKATDQLNGTVSTLKCRVAQKIRRWDADTQTWLDPVASNNPAWIYLWLLTECPAMKRHVDISRVDVDGIARWAAWCDAHGMTYSGVIDSTRVCSDVIKDVLACGLATFGVKNGLYSVVRDIQQNVPMQVYTPINGTSIKWSRSFSDPPHALRCSFTNPEAENQQDEMVVYWDGYDQTNATHIEVLDLRSCTSPESCWRIARYHLAVMWLRPNQYVIETDLEHLVNERGDLVEVAAPILGWGVGFGRIKEVISDTEVILDQPFDYEAGKTYAMRLRLDNAYSNYSVLTINAGDVVNGKVSHVHLQTAITELDVEQIFIIGEVNKVSLPLIISSIQPGGNMLERSATLTLVDADPGVWTAIEGTPPPFTSNINHKPWCDAPDPPVVHIRTGSTAPNDAGVIHATAGVAGQPNSGIHRMPIYTHGGPFGGCPVVEAEVQRVLDDGSIEKIRAGDVKVGDKLLGADPKTLENKVYEVTYSEPELQPCVVLSMASGHTLPCSSSAPIPISEGRLVKAPNCYGHKVAVQLIADNEWSRVEHLAGIGRQWVQHISINDGCFWVNGVLHHNKQARAENR